MENVLKLRKGIKMLSFCFKKFYERGAVNDLIN